MSARTRHEASIKRSDAGLGRDLEEAIATLAFRNGLSWFTDDQIGDIRELMVRRDWRSNRSAMASRKHHAAFIESRQPKKEPA